MKTSLVNITGAVAGLIVLLAVSASSAFGQVPEKGSAKGGAMLLVKRSKPVPASNYQLMSCAKCRDTAIKVRDNRPTQGAAARALLASGVPTTLVSRHACEGCGVEWKATGHGKAKTSVAIHKCSACGAEGGACCGAK